jgi:biopolymer transport protein ExbD
MKGFAPDEESVTFQMAPMIDVVFLLIIFFMVAANMKQKVIVKIDVPVADKAVVSQNPGNRGIITVMSDGSIYAGSTPLDAGQLPGHLAEISTNVPGFRVVIRGDQNAPHRIIREVLAHCAAAGIDDIIFSAHQTDK